MPHIGRSLPHRAAAWIIKCGTENTSWGNWVTGCREAAEHFGVAEAEIKNCAEEIMDIIVCNEAVADACICDESFDVTYYLDYCLNLEHDAYINLYEYLDQDLMIEHIQAKLLDEILSYIYDAEYPSGYSLDGALHSTDQACEIKSGYLEDIESYGTALREAVGEPVKWGMYTDNALRHLMYICRIDAGQLAAAIDDGHFPLLDKQRVQITEENIRVDPDLSEYTRPGLG
jgi:hypothetical protein